MPEQDKTAPQQQAANPYRIPSQSPSLRAEDVRPCSTPDEIVADIFFYSCAEDINLIFARQVRQLSMADQKQVADAIEARFKPLFDEAARGGKDLDDSRIELKDYHKFAAMMNLVAQIKGKDADAFVRHHAAAVAAMTDEQFHSGDAHEALLYMETADRRAIPGRSPDVPRP